MKFGNGITLVAFSDPGDKIKALQAALFYIERARENATSPARIKGLNDIEEHLYEIIKALSE